MKNRKNLWFSGAVTMAFMAMLSFGVMAAEEGVVYGGKKILMTDVSDASSSDGRTFQVNDLSSGIYITVANISLSARYPNLEAVVRERFASKGIKLVDQPVGASMSLAFSALGDLDMSDAESKASHSNMPNTVNIFGAVGAAAAAGAPGIIAFMAGGLFPSDSKTTFSALVILKPVKAKSFFGGEMIDSSVDGGIFTNGVLVKYKLEKENEATEDLVFMMLIDQWLKRYVASNADPVAASAVPATEPLAKGE